MSFHMLLQVLGTLEGLATELATMRLQGHMNSDVRRDVVAFNDLNGTICPGALQIEIVSTFAADVFIADVVLAKH